MANELTKNPRAKPADPASDKAWQDSWHATLDTLEKQLEKTPAQYHEEVGWAAMTALFVALTEQGHSRESIVRYLLTGPR